MGRDGDPRAGACALRAVRRPEAALARAPAPGARGRLAVALVLLVGGGVIAYELLKRPADIHNAERAFQPQKPKAQKRKTVSWPLYGYDRARTRYLPAKGVKPPFRKSGATPTGRCSSSRRRSPAASSTSSTTAASPSPSTPTPASSSGSGGSAASTPPRPTYYKHRLYIVNLVPGHVVKLDARTGRILWKHSLPGAGRVLAGRRRPQPLLRLRRRQPLLAQHPQRQRALGDRPRRPVKAAPAYYGGVLYVGDYGGYMNAVEAKNGRLIWQSDSLGQGFGTSGAFYSTPAVAFGRVYAGNNDTRVYSFDRHDGTIAWTYSTGGYVYSGPAVASTRHTGPTVYIGSFDGNVYALNAKSGEPRWIRSAGGSVIGSLTAVGDIVYAAEFNGTSTTGYAMKGGRTVFRYPRGTYTAVVSDGRRIYLVGYSSITALQPFKYRAGLRTASRHEPTRGSRPSVGGPVCRLI